MVNRRREWVSEGGAKRRVLLPLLLLLVLCGAVLVVWVLISSRNSDVTGRRNGPQSVPARRSLAEGEAGSSGQASRTSLSPEDARLEPQPVTVPAQARVLFICRDQVGAPVPNVAIRLEVAPPATDDERYRDDEGKEQGLKTGLVPNGRDPYDHPPIGGDRFVPADRGETGVDGKMELHAPVGFMARYTIVSGHRAELPQVNRTRVTEKDGYAVVEARDWIRSTSHEFVLEERTKISVKIYTHTGVRGILLHRGGRGLEATRGVQVSLSDCENLPRYKGPTFEDATWTNEDGYFCWNSVLPGRKLVTASWFDDESRTAYAYCNQFDLQAGDMKDLGSVLPVDGDTADVVLRPVPAESATRDLPGDLTVCFVLTELPPGAPGYQDKGDVPLHVSVREVVLGQPFRVHGLRKGVAYWPSVVCVSDGVEIGMPEEHLLYDGQGVLEIRVPVRFSERAEFDK